jgi:hypothetical protein
MPLATLVLRTPALVFFMQICLWHLHKKYFPTYAAAFGHLYFNYAFFISGEKD